MAGNHYLDAGPGYGRETRRDVEAQEAFERAEAMRWAFAELAKRHAAEAVELARKIGADPSAAAVKWAETHKITCEKSLADSIESDFLYSFNVPDPDEAADDVRRGY